MRIFREHNERWASNWASKGNKGAKVTMDASLSLINHLIRPELFAYYTTLHTLMDQKWLLKDSWAIVIPGIGTDLSVPWTLFGYREIIGFDTFWDPSEYPWREYNGYEIRRALEEIPSMHIHSKLWKKYILWSAPKEELDESYRFLLVCELLGSTGVDSSVMEITFGEEHTMEYVRLSATDHSFPPITIYKNDVFDEHKREAVTNILKSKTVHCYLEKAGQKIMSKNCIPLEILLETKNVQVLAMWDQMSGQPRKSNKQLAMYNEHNPEWDALWETHEEDDLLIDMNIKLYEHMKRKDETWRKPLAWSIDWYWRDMLVYYRKKQII